MWDVYVCVWGMCNISMWDMYNISRMPISLCSLCSYMTARRAEAAARQYRVEANAKVQATAKISETKVKVQKLTAGVNTLQHCNDKLTTRLHEEDAQLRSMQQAMHDIVACFNDKLDRATNMRIVSPVGLAKALDLSPNSSEKVSLYSGRGIWKTTKLLDATPPNGKK